MTTLTLAFVFLLTAGNHNVFAFPVARKIRPDQRTAGKQTWASELATGIRRPVWSARRACHSGVAQGK